MKKLALLAGAALLALGSIEPAQAQRFYDDGGWDHPRRVVRERVVVRHAPVIRQRVVVRHAPIIRERIVYRSAPIVRQRIVYRPAPVIRQRVVYRQAPVVRKRVVVRRAPAYRTQRVVYRAAPVIRQRVVYEQPRLRIVRQPAYSTRVTFREPLRERVVVRRTIRDFDSGDRWERRMHRRMMWD